MRIPVRRIFPPFVLVLFLGFVQPVPLSAETIITGSLNWEHMTLDLTARLNLQKAGIRLPAGRYQAETLLEDEFFCFAEELIMYIQADSSSTLGDLVIRGELTTASFTRNTRRFPPALSADISSINGRAAVNLTGIAGELIRHSRPRTIYPPLIPVPVRDYTGIIIIADGELPVHGRFSSALAVPCIFPKVWDSEMNLIYGRDTIDPGTGRETSLVRYISRESIMRAVPSAMDPSLIERMGDNPLRIMAQGLFGAVPTDPIIDKEDALLILSSENNRQLLREGRVAIVLDKKYLVSAIPSF